MAEIIAQYILMTWVGVILVCIVWSFCRYILGSIEKPGKRNKQLLNDMNKLKQK
tara:strand:- start:2258 stop:2419 length:162 start_codon:yes stop_codon:yes gene_type:complete